MFITTNQKRKSNLLCQKKVNLICSKAGFQLLNEGMRRISGYRLFVVLIVLCSGFDVFAQRETYEIPHYFSRFDIDPRANLFSFEENEELTMSFIDRRNLNNFGGISNSFFLMQYKLPRKNNAEPFHALGFQFFNQREGFLIRRNRLYFGYSYHLSLNEKYKIAAGIQAGVFNFLIKPEGNFEGLSKLAPDGNFLFKFYNEDLSMQFSVNQFLNNSIQPVLDELILLRQYSLYAKKYWDMNENFKVSVAINSRFSKNTESVYSGYQQALGVALHYNDLIFLGCNYDIFDGSSVYAGIRRYEIGKAAINLGMGYFMPVMNTNRIRINRIEIDIKFSLLELKNTQ